MRRKIAVIGAIATLAVTGTAFAGGGGGGLFGDDRQQDFAEDLATELNGVSPGEVEQALDVVGEQRIAEHRTRMAQGIAAQLDGVDADAVSDALATHEKQVRSAIESGERPDMQGLVATLADELGKSEEEITSALEAAREAGVEDRKAEALERLEGAVEDGELTEKQADEIRERIESGPAFGPGHHGPGGPGFGPGGPAPGGESQKGAGFGGPQATPGAAT
jgi:hypothetical protein